MARDRKRGTGEREMTRAFRPRCLTRSIARELRPALGGVFLQQPQLLGLLLPLLSARDVYALCEAAQVCRAGVAMLLRQPMWSRLLLADCPVAWGAGGIHPAISTMRMKLRFDCYDLVNYVNLRRQCDTFRDCVWVVKGDLGAIDTVGGHKVDCLVFPTSTNFRDPRRGVAGSVHARAGPALDKAVTSLGRDGRRAAPGTVMSTVGFGSGVNLLVHCVGPFGRENKSAELLYKTYVDALWAIHHNDVMCAAVASISTGLKGYRYKDAAPIAVRAVRDMIRCKTGWSAKIVFVCFEQEAYEEFIKAWGKMLDGMHSDGFLFPSVLSPELAAGSRS